MYHLLSSFFELFATFSVYYCQTGVIRLVPWTVLNQVLISAKNPFYKTYYHMVCVLPFINLTTMCFFTEFLKLNKNQEAEVTENLKNGIVQYQN